MADPVKGVFLVSPTRTFEPPLPVHNRRYLHTSLCAELARVGWQEQREAGESSPGQ